MIHKLCTPYTDNRFEVARCADLGKLLGSLLSERFESCEYVGDVRGRGLFWAIEFVRDRETKASFPSSMGFAYKLNAESLRRGVSLYPGSGTVDGEVGDHLMFAPAYTSSEAEIHHIVTVAYEAYLHVVAELGLS